MPTQPTYINHHGCDAVNVWQRFVTVFREDQDLISNYFANQPSSGQRKPFRPIVSNYTGNPQTVITHPRGEAQQYERCASGVAQFLQFQAACL